MSQAWTVRSGLMVMWIDNIAMANDFEFPGAADGNVTFVGLNIGMTAQW